MLDFGSQMNRFTGSRVIESMAHMLLRRRSSLSDLGAVWKIQPVDLTAKRELQESSDGWAQEIAGLRAQHAEAQKKIVEYRNAMNQNAEEKKEISGEKAATQKVVGEFRILPTKSAS